MMISLTLTLISFLSSGLGSGLVILWAPHATVMSLGSGFLMMMSNLALDSTFNHSYWTKQWAAVTRITGSQLKRTAEHPKKLPSLLRRAHCQGNSFSWVTAPPRILW